jgi:hypothetical protein
METQSPHPLQSSLLIFSSGLSFVLDVGIAICFLPVDRKSLTPLQSGKENPVCKEKKGDMDISFHAIHAQHVPLQTGSDKKNILIFFHHEVLNNVK